jgi:hypothetical protein
MNYEELGLNILNQVRARTPKVSGNLARNTRFFNTGFGDVWGHLVVETPYAQFVNYGYQNHPNSRKLRNDYLYIEKSINQVLKIALKGVGADVK